MVNDPEQATMHALSRAVELPHTVHPFTTGCMWKMLARCRQVQPVLDGRSNEPSPTTTGARTTALQTTRKAARRRPDRGAHDDDVRHDGSKRVTMSKQPSSSNECWPSIRQLRCDAATLFEKACCRAA